MKNIKKYLAASLIFCLSSMCIAEVAVVVHPSRSVASLDDKEISRIFLGKSKSFPEGDSASPILQSKNEAVHEKFTKKMCRKSASQFKAFWSRLVFTGKAKLPQEAKSDDEVKELIAANPNMIGYIDSDAVDSSVKVVIKLP